MDLVPQNSSIRSNCWELNSEVFFKLKRKLNGAASKTFLSYPIKRIRLNVTAISIFSSYGEAEDKENVDALVSI